MVSVRALLIDGVEVDRLISFEASERLVEFVIVGAEEADWLDVRCIDDLSDWEIERLQRWEQASGKAAA